VGGGPLFNVENVMMLVGVTDAVTGLVPATKPPSLCRHVTVTSEMYGEPKKRQEGEEAPATQSGKVVDVADNDNVVSSPGGPNAELLPPPPPPQLANTVLASNKMKNLHRAFMSNLRTRDFMYFIFSATAFAAIFIGA